MVAVDLVDAAATRALGVALASVLVPGDVVLLSGELGAGKTTLVGGVVAGLGGDPTEVTSPTFTLCHLYPTEPVVAHVDCWRLDTTAEIADLALDEVLEEGGVALIEWGERAAALFGEEALVLELAPSLAGEGRRATWRGTGESWTSRAGTLAAALQDAGYELRGLDESTPAVPRSLQS
jgi:tRNA threonylcarbamoyladenosine biosynthesis protein TsaE